MNRFSKVPISKRKSLRVAAVQMIFAGRKLHNALVVFDRCGRLVHAYAKCQLVEELDLSRATRKYALDSLKHPRFLASHWQQVLRELRRRVRETDLIFQQRFNSTRSASVP